MTNKLFAFVICCELLFGGFFIHYQMSQNIKEGYKTGCMIRSRNEPNCEKESLNYQATHKPWGII